MQIQRVETGASLVESHFEGSHSLSIWPKQGWCSDAEIKFNKMVKSDALCKHLIKYQWLIWPHSVQFSSVFKYNRWKKQTLRQYGRNCLQRKLRHTRWTNIWLQDWSSRVWTIWSMETISASHNLDKKKICPVAIAFSLMCISTSTFWNNTGCFFLPMFNIKNKWKFLEKVFLVDCYLFFILVLKIGRNH